MEHYLTIEKHPNYEVSNLGNIRNKTTGVVRKQTDRKGYRKVRLNNKDEAVHRLVADTFYDGMHDGLQVNHIDGNKANNFLGNLEWVTSSENVKHAYNSGLKQHSGGLPSIRLVDLTTGITYESVAECAKSIGGTRAGIVYAIQHDREYKNHKLVKEA